MVKYSILGGKGVMIKTLFTRRLFLNIMLDYDRLGIELAVSSRYPSCVSCDYWGVSLSTLEMILYPLQINISDALLVLENQGSDAFANLEPSEEFIPIIHDRRLVLDEIQNIMKEKTQSNKCRAIMSKNLGKPITYVSNDFRCKLNSISMFKLESYANAADVKLSDVFISYFNSYGDEFKGK